MSIELKIKLKHLAEEARIIRTEAHKQYAAGNYQKGNDLTDHRKGKLRRAARATHIAYGYLRGVPYSRIEKTSKTEPDWKAVVRMVRDYGEDSADDGLAHWYELREEGVAATG